MIVVPESAVLLATAQNVRNLKKLAPLQFLRTLTKPQIFYLGLLLIPYEHVLHKLYRRWDSNHNSILPPKLSKHYDPLVKKWERLYDLTIQLHARPRPGRIVSYSNGTVWLAKILLEEIQWEVRLASYWEQEAKTGKTVGKTKAAQTVQKDFLKPLRNYENPFSHQDQTHLAYTVDEGISLAETSEDFRKKFWSPYVLALSNWVRDIERGNNHEFLFLGDKAGVRNRRGRGTTGQDFLDIPAWVERTYEELHPSPIILLS